MLEACVDSIESALSAQAGGADRVELCDNLLEGGTTPSAGMLALCCARLAIPVHVLIRPRGGDFVYSDLELDVMRRDIAVAKQHGAAGVVFGILLPDGSIDVPRTRSLIAAARPLAVTFHRAFDFTKDPDVALDDLIAMGIDRVLTSGQAPSAAAGTGILARLVRRAAGRIAIAAGGGLSEDNVLAVIEQTGVAEVHVRATALLESVVAYRPTHLTLLKQPLPNEYDRAVTDPGRIRRLVLLLEKRPLAERHQC
ncbi:MAG TPA: copper homeostasis protein CutC [Gemmatimonadales bacterium]|jgi:copper homeostasis protein